MKKEITGYKSVDENFKNIAGKKLEEGKSYHADGIIKYGINGNGYHFAKNLEDTLRFQLKDNYHLVKPNIAKVIGFGNIINSSDEYYGYYDLYTAENIKILKFLTHDDIINYALKLREERMRRFVSLYKLTNEEIKFFKNKYHSVDLALLYHQKQQIDIYMLYYESLHSKKESEKIKQLMKNL